MKSINKRFVIEKINLSLPDNNVKTEQRQINNLIGIVVDTRYTGSDTANIYFNDINNNPIDSWTLQFGVYRYFYSRPVSMYLDNIAIIYFNQISGGTNIIPVNIWLIGQKTIEFPTYRGV